MFASRFEPRVVGDPDAAAALRLALAFAAALTWAEAIDLELTFVAPLTAAALAVSAGPSLATLVLLPLGAWGMIAGVAFAVEGFAEPAPLAFALLVAAGLWTGFRLSTRSGVSAVVGLLVLLFVAIAPMRVLAYPEAAETAVNDIARNVLVGTLTAWIVNLFLPGPPARPPRDLPAPLPPIAAALVTGLACYLVWIYEPPAPGAVLVGILITLRADDSPGVSVARDRVIAALVGGGAAVAAATLVALAPTLPMLFLAVLVLAWPFALRASRGDAWRGAALKTLNVLAILVAEGFSPLFEDTEERLWIRIAGVLVGLAYATLALALLAGPAAGDHPSAPAGAIPLEKETM
jgi:hypothetical protein